MRDTRLLHARQHIEAALEILAELQAEGIKSPHDMVARAEKLGAAAAQAVSAAFTEELCGALAGGSHRCALVGGHDGPHRDGDFEWVVGPVDRFTAEMGSGRYGRLD